jgi:probable phosphoglycerate mutase
MPCHQPPVRIHLLRHAESEWNATGRWQGHGDPPLSERGLEEARARASVLGAELASAGRNLRVFSSDLRRARDTAACLGTWLGQPVIAVPALRELDVGRWSGLTRTEIASSDPVLLAAFDCGDPDVRPGGGESRRELRVRVHAAVEALAERYPRTDLLLVVHLGVIDALVPGTRPANLALVSSDLAAVRGAAERRA